MDSFNIVMVIAIILFARLGIRLLMNYKKFKNEDDKDSSDENGN
jgi:hypothetical protein